MISRRAKPKPTFVNQGVKKKKHMRWVLALFFLFAGYVIFFYTNDYIVNKSQRELEQVEENYGREVDSLCKKLDLPSSYMKALIMLECSGDKPVDARFEEHVFARLQQVRDGKKKKLENLKTKHLRGMSDEALKNLARSWGPFQVMGYKSVQMKITIQDLRGEKAVYWGIKWINKDYGKLLRKKKYKDAFHFHNTGRHFPSDGESLTHDPQYVTRGLKYMEYFDNLKEKQSVEK